VARIGTWLIDYWGAEDTPLVRAIGRKMLVAAVRRARSPGCKFDFIPVLLGGGKALAFLRLASIRLMLRKLCNPT
jgi:predicted P-loop ATPase